MIVLDTNVLSELLRPVPAPQVLAWFDGHSADAYAEIAASRRVQGRPISQSDAMIAGIARSLGAALASRNVKDFHDCGIEVIDPWAG